jgi:hypothetical protein
VVGSAIQFIGLFWQSLPRQSIDLYPEMRNCYKHSLVNCDSEDDANADLGKVASSNPIQSTSQSHLTQCKKKRTHQKMTTQTLRSAILATNTSPCSVISHQQKKN